MHASPGVIARLYPNGYNLRMNIIQRTAVFADWLEKLSDVRGKARIVARIAAASVGNFGDCAPVGQGVSEMRIDFGPGYRVYFMREGPIVYLLLCAGDKSSQKADIARAHTLAGKVRTAAAPAGAVVRRKVKKG